MDGRDEGATACRRRYLVLNYYWKNQAMWKHEKHLESLSTVKKVRVDEDPFFLLSFLLFEAFVSLYTSHMLQNDSCVATALCHMQEQLWVLLSRPLYVIHCTLGKKGVLPSAWEHVDGRGVQTTFLASSPVESADPVLGNLHFNAAVPFSRSFGDFGR